MKTIICGGRDYEFVLRDYERLNQLKLELPITEVVSGAQKKFIKAKHGFVGADHFAERWAKACGLPVKKFPADWNKFGPPAGPLRNLEMAKYAEACIALPGGKGTANMLKQAQERGLRVFDFRV